MSTNQTPAPSNGASAPAAPTNGKISVVFLHPRDERQFSAHIGPATTGNMAIDGLVKAEFISAPTPSAPCALVLQRTGKTIPLHTALMDAGVRAEDTIQLVVPEEGAHG
jgi:hypothetical protein